jgi:hypothetical protein
VPALIQTLSNRDWEARCAALRQIGKPSARTVPVLLRLLKQDPHKEVRRSSAHGLQEIGAPRTKAVPALRAALKDKEPMVRNAATEALERYGAALKKAKPVARQSGRRKDK